MDLTEKKLKKFRERCLIEAKQKFGMSEEDAQEFAQEYLLMLTTKGWRQTTGQACIDFVRKRFGRTRELGDSGKKIVPINFTDLDATRGKNYIERIPTDGSDNGRRRMALEEFIRGAQDNKRIVLVLMYKWGFNLADIGEVLGVSESRVSQVHSSAMRLQKERIKKETARENARQGQQSQSRSVSSEIQKRSCSETETKRGLEPFLSKQKLGVALLEVKTIPETIQRSFRINTF